MTRKGGHWSFFLSVRHSAVTVPGGNVEKSGGNHRTAGRVGGGSAGFVHAYVVHTHDADEEYKRDEAHQNRGRWWLRHLE